MKIGLLRHFKVTRGYPKGRVNAAELRQWLEEYEQSDVERTAIDLQGFVFDTCYSSDITRAKITAEAAFDGEIIYLPDLREIPLAPMFNWSLRLPLVVHIILMRFAWFINHHSSLETRDDVYARIDRVLDRVISENRDVLLVGHGGIMMFMRKRLLARGFTGPKFGQPDNATLYLFEK